MSITHYVDTKPPKVVFFFGTGISEGSWGQVRNSLLKLFPEMPLGEENLAFATVVYKLRQRAAAYQGGLKMLGWKHFSEYFKIKEIFSLEIQRYYDFKKDIAEALIKAVEQREIVLRPLTTQVVEKWADSTSNVIITTNWDLVLEQTFQDIFVFHLHGDVKDPKTLYLPSEHSWENYHQIEAKSKVSAHNKRITHGNWLATGIEKLIIYGLSLSPLDAEINSLLHCAVEKGPIPELIIIDPDPEPVFRRVKFHTQDRILKYQLLTPEQALLDTPDV